jgi:hypothetical protein
MRTRGMKARALLTVKRTLANNKPPRRQERQEEAFWRPTLREAAAASMASLAVRLDLGAKIFGGEAAVQSVGDMVLEVQASHRLFIQVAGVENHHIGAVGGGVIH